MTGQLAPALSIPFQVDRLHEHCSFERAVVSNVMPQSRPNLALACTLSALAGYVDAIGFLHLGGLYVSFMSGNSTRLGVTLAEAQWQQALKALALIALFVAGAAAGSLVARSRIAPRQPLILLIEAGLLVAAAVAHAYGEPNAAIAAIVLAMGLENEVFQTEGGAGLGLTYVTGALAKTGQLIAAALTGGAGWAWLPSLLLWAALVTGALFGAAAYRWINLAAIWFAAGTAFGLSALVAATAKRTD